MGVPRRSLGPWSPKYIISIIFLPHFQVYKKVVLQLIEHGDVIEAQTIHINMHVTQTLSPQSFLANSVPALYVSA